MRPESDSAISGGRYQVWVAALVGFASCLFAISTGIPFGTPNADGNAARAGLPTFESFPIWDAAPGGPAAVIHEGNFRGMRWGAYASRVGSGPRAKTAPCITLATLTHYGEYGHVSKCEVVPSQATADWNPQYDLLGRTETGPKGRTISSLFFATVLPNNVATLKIKVEPGGSVVKPTERLTGKQLKATKLSPFRYVAFAKRRDGCVLELIGFDSDGKRIFDAPQDECPLGRAGASLPR